MSPDTEQEVRDYCEGVIRTFEQHGGTESSVTIARGVLSLLNKDAHRQVGA